MFNPLRLFSRKHKLPLAVGFTGKGVALIQLKPGPDALSAPVLELLPADTPEAQDQVLRERVGQLGLSRRDACTCLAPGRYSLMMVDDPGVQPQERNDALRWQIKDLLDFPVEEAVIDALEAPQRRDGSHNLFAVAARQSEVRNLAERLTAADLTPLVVDIPEQAVRNVLARLPDGDRAAAYLHLEPHAGLIVLVVERTPVLSRQLDRGYRDLLTALLEQPAEPVPTSSGSDVGDLDLELPAVNQGAAALLDRLTLELQRSIDYYDSSFSQYRLSRVYLSPIFQEMPEAVQYLNENLGATVETLEPARLLAECADLDSATQNGSLMTLGLALRMLDGES